MLDFPRFLLIPIVFFVLTGYPETSEPPVRIGISPWSGYEILFLAQEKGFFAEQGVEVNLIELHTLGDTRRAFERKLVDGMASTVVEVVETAMRTSRTPQIILATDFSNGSDVIIANVGIDSLNELKGKRVATESGYLDYFILSRALQTVGMNLDDIVFVRMGVDSMLEVSMAA